MIANATKMIEAQHNLKAISSNSSSEASLNEDSSDNLEIDSEDDFHPELFGLLEDPGVVRFDCVDYPLAVIKHSDDKDQGEAVTELGNKYESHDPEIAKSGRNILARSLDSIPSINIVTKFRIDCHLLYYSR